MRYFCSFNITFLYRPKYTFDKLLPANYDTAIKNKLEFLEEKREQVTSLYNKGLSMRDITKQAFGNEGLMTMISFGHYSKINFTKSLLGITRYPIST